MDPDPQKQMRIKNTAQQKGAKIVLKTAIGHHRSMRRYASFTPASHSWWVRNIQLYLTPVESHTSVKTRKSRKIHTVSYICEKCYGVLSAGHSYRQSCASYFQKVTSVDLVRWVGPNKHWKLSVAVHPWGYKRLKLSVSDKSNFKSYLLTSPAKNKRWKLCVVKEVLWNNHSKIPRKPRDRGHGDKGQWTTDNTHRHGHWQGH